VQYRTLVADGRLWRASWYFRDTRLFFSRPQAKPSSGVLLVRLDAIGDFVVWLSAARELRDHYRAKGHQIVLLANSSWSTWARTMSLADEIIDVDRDRFIVDGPYRHGLLRNIRQRQFMTVVQPVVSMMVISDLLVRVSGARERIGVAWDNSMPRGPVRWLRASWYTRLIKVDQAGDSEIRRNAAFVSQLTHVPLPAEPPRLTPMRSRLSSSRSRYAVLFPGASWAGRMWPIQNFAAIGRLIRNCGLDIIIAGGASEAAQCSTLEAELGEPVDNQCGRTSLAELAAMMQFSEVVVSNETSAIHIAAGVRAPAVCIVGGGHFGRFVPYDADEPSDSLHSIPIPVFQKMACFNCNWQCIYPRQDHEPVRCIAEITVESVWCEVEKLLANRSARSSDASASC
jgi:ADP-heptose:LPS heptosyltransferase